MRKTLLVTAVVVAACGATEEIRVTTTVPGIATTTLAPTTTLAGAPTTTVAATTTTSTSTTPTTQPAEGNWAEQPLIVTGFGALGWWDGAAWVLPEDAGGLPVFGGEDYQVAALGVEAVITGGQQEFVCEPVVNLGVVLEREELLGDWPGPYGVAISAPWELQPHLFDAVEDDGTYAAFASELLAERGLDVPQPVIKQLFRTDLDGDGTNEVVVVAEHIQGELIFPQVGDYSIIFLRKVVEGEVVTSVLGEAVVTDPEGAFMLVFSVGGVADLSGDGKMEIVVDSAYYEGLGVEVWEYVNDDLGPLPQLQIWCGA